MPKIANLDAFLTIMKQELGNKEFDSYMNTPNYLSADLKVSVGDLYLKDHGDINSPERAVLSKDKKKILQKFLPKNDKKPEVRIDNVDTHNVASHKTGDESHVMAFKMMVEANGINVNADYEAPSKADDPSRVVKINDKGNLDQFVTTQITQLKDDVDRLVLMNDAEIYNEYLRYNDIEKFKAIEYKDLETKDKESFDKKIIGLQFQAKTAKRYIDNMITDHKCNSGNYPYKTDEINSNGLTIEQMVAASYWASKDKGNFKSRDVTEQGNFLSLVRQIYDMRRGYDIDYGTDKPDELRFPANPGIDHNRCAGGGINSLSWALASAHIAYNPKKIERSDIEREISQIYEKIIADHIDDIKNIMAPEERSIWAANSKVTGNVREYLDSIFRAEYLQDFENHLKGYVPDVTFYNIVEQGLDNVKMPEVLNLRIEEMSFEEIKSGISEGIIPLIHLDSELGYESTLNYLSRLSGKAELIKDLYEFAVRNSTPNAIVALKFLSQSNLSPEYKNLEVFRIKDASVKLSEIASLRKREVEALYTIEADVIGECIAKIYPNLFALYYKKIGSNQEELIKVYGDNRCTSLHYAAINGYSEIVKAILQTLGIDKQKLLEIQDTQSHWTALHYAVYHGQAEVIKAILETPGRLPEIKDKNAYTPLRLAVWYGKVDLVKILLEHQVSTVGLKGDEKEIVKCLNPEDLREVLKIQFSDELGEANSSIRLERENLVLKGVYNYLKTYGTDKSWISHNAWAGSLNRMHSRVNALMDEMDGMERVAGGVVVQREIDRIMEGIMSKLQDQPVRNYIGKANSVQNQNMNRR